jgi:Flp pilus assembly protein TadB
MPSAVKRQKQLRRQAADAKKLKKANKKLKCQVKAQKAKTKKAKNKAQPMARRFVAMIQKAPTMWAFVILILAIAGVVAFYFREHGPAVTLLLLLAGAVGGFVVWAFQSAATKKNHK